jgi:hypothetical protein
VKTRFQSLFAFKFNLHRYITGLSTSRAEMPAIWSGASGINPTQFAPTGVNTDFANMVGLYKLKSVDP